MKVLLSEDAVSEILALLKRIEGNTIRCPDTEAQFKRVRQILIEG
jgi:hypothetical protein